MVSSSSDVSGPRPVGIHWEYAIPLLAVHLAAALVLIPSLFSWSGLVLALVGTHLFGMLGINICYHRLLTHRSLAVPRWLEQTLATIAVFSLEDSPVRWVATHRLHHAHSDAAADPHSPVHGISWAHTGWLVRPAPDRRTLAFFDRYARDVLAVPYYRWFEKRPMRVLWVYLAQIPLFALAGWLFGLACGDTPAQATLLAGSWVVWGVLLRTVLVWHQTWCVNSLSHLFGYRNYETGENSRNNWLVALLAAGEGWHNNHHHDPVSASVQHRWWEIDITYYVILLLARLGLARDIVLPRHIRQANAANTPRTSSAVMTTSQ